MLRILRIGAGRITRSLHEKGLRPTAALTMRVITKPLFEISCIHFYRACVDQPGPALQLDSSLSIDIVQHGDGDADALMMDRDDTALAQEIATRFGRGDRCVVVQDAGGKLMHSRWLSRQPTFIPEIERFIAPQHGQFYMYDGYTRREARGKGVDGAVRLFIFALAKQEGAHEVLSYVHSSNLPGLKAASKLQQEVGCVSYVSTLKRCRHFSIDKKLEGHVRLLSRNDLEHRKLEYAARREALNRWFQSWRDEPMAKRSTGFSMLSEPWLMSAASFIVNTLMLDPQRDEVLDVGCSSAVVSRHVAPHCRSFHGVDATPGLIEDIPEGSVKTSTGEPAIFSVADGQRLPFPSGTFTKVYCSGVIHMLPSTDDALRVVDELLRVCKPGGSVLLAAVPDLAKKSASHRLVWRRSDSMTKAKILAHRLLPSRLRNTIRRKNLIRSNAIAFLEFDFDSLRSRYESRGFRCQVLDFPTDYCSEDFRTSRSNMLISSPPSATTQ